MIHNNGTTAAQVTGLSLSQGKVFAIDPSVAQNFTVPASATSPVLIHFTPADTVMYYDTLNVLNNTQDTDVLGYLTGEGKVVVYTALVPTALQYRFRVWKWTSRS